MTELVFILDRSGSMSGLEGDTIGGFNSMLQKQKREAGDALVTTVLFNTRSVTIHDRAKLQEVAPLTQEDYTVSGGTALLDALGGTIRHIARIHKYARKEDVPGKTLFVITTDGCENASRHYSYPQVRELIAHEKEKYGWEFLFLGANIDAIGEAKRFGIDADRAVSYKSDKCGTKLNYDVIGEAVHNVRVGKGIDPNWKKRIDEDVKTRGK